MMQLFRKTVCLDFCFSKELRLVCEFVNNVKKKVVCYVLTYIFFCKYCLQSEKNLQLITMFADLVLHQSNLLLKYIGVLWFMLRVNEDNIAGWWVCEKVGVKALHALSWRTYQCHMIVLYFSIFYIQPIH